MKKVLAIILTIAMLASMCATGVFAGQQVVSQDDATVNHYWHFQSGNSWHPVKFDNPSNTVEMDVKFDANDKGDASLGCYGLSNAPSFTLSSVGVTKASVDYNFATDTWYHVKWVSDGSTTDIYVNGELVGTADAAITYYDGNQFYWAPIEMSMDNVSVGGQTFDFEGEDQSRWNTESAQGELVAEEIPGDIHNEIVATGVNHYWHFQSGNSWHPVKFDNPSDTVEMDVKFDANDKGDASLGCYGLSNAPSFTLSSVGVTAATVPYSFATDTWYHVKWVSDGSTTDIYVNGEKVGTADAAITYYDGNQFYWAPIEMSMDNVSVGGQTFDFEGEDQSRWNTESAQGELVAEEVETYRADLGTAYWMFTPGNSWHPVKFDNPANTVELDVRLDDAESNLGCYGLSNAPSLTPTSVGVTSASVNYNFTVGAWYHIKWVSDGSTTDIYVDGVYAGTANAAITYYESNQFYWAPDKISMDNVSVGGQTFDFEAEDQSRWNTESSQGERVLYDLTIASDSIFDHIETYAVEGEAFLERAAWDEEFVYFDHSGMSPQGNNFIMNFDLALIPNTESNDGTWIELWTNVASRRFKVGTKYTGRDDDLTAFDWGEATATNFHNVTYVMNQDYQKAQIYVDKELVYEGASGSTWDSRFIGGIWNGSAIIDNYKVYTLDYQEVSTNMWSSRPDCQVYIDDINGDICAQIGHVAGLTTKTVQETCTNYGKLETVCGICGEVSEEHQVAMVAHKWWNYDFNRRVDGLIYTQCGTCGQRKYTTLPEADTYTGTIYEHYTVQDDMILCVDNSWDSGTWAYEGDAIKFGKSTNNYNIFSVASGSIPLNNYSWNLDIVYRGAFNTSDTERHEDGKAGYGHVLYFWFGGQSTVKFKAGYNADEHKLFIMTGEGNQDDPFPSGDIAAKTVDFTMIEGETYNIQLSVYYVNDEDSDAYGTVNVSLIVNGKTYLSFTNKDKRTALQLINRDDESKLGYNILRNFGVGIDVKTLTFASSDFAYDRVYFGDADGDYALTAADALLMRKYLAKVVGADALAVSRADANEDGAINAKDQLVIRKALMA